MRYLLLAMVMASCVVTNPAHAEGPVFDVGYNCTFRWAQPTTRTDGSDLDASKIHRSNIYVSRSPDLTDAIVVAAQGVSLRCESITGLTVGQYYAAVSTVDNRGLESVKSDAIGFSFRDAVVVAPPSPPSTFRIE
jgi:hypothetical protein